MESGLRRLGGNMNPRGNTRIIIQKVGEIQKLVGEAKALHDNDRDKNGHYLAQKKLDEAHELCIEIRNMYDPI